MPIYEFECQGCRTRFEKLCGMSAGAGDIFCPECRGDDVRKLISSFYSRSSSPDGSTSSSSGCTSCRKSSCAGCR